MTTSTDLSRGVQEYYGATLSSSGALSVTSALENTIVTTAQGGAKGGGGESLDEMFALHPGKIGNS